MPAGPRPTNEALGHSGVPFAEYRPDHRTGLKLATIDAHRAAEAALDLERRLDDGVAREGRRGRFEIGNFEGSLRRAIPFSSTTKSLRTGALATMRSISSPH
jgi:hypothetical protein